MVFKNSKNSLLIIINVFINRVKKPERQLSTEQIDYLLSDNILKLWAGAPMKERVQFFS